PLLPGRRNRLLEDHLAGPRGSRVCVRLGRRGARVSHALLRPERRQAPAEFSLQRSRDRSDLPVLSAASRRFTPPWRRCNMAARATQGEFMKTTALAGALSLFVCACATAQTLEDLKNDGKNTDNILTYGMGYSQHRYSPLNQVNKATVKRLVPVWNLSLDNNWGEQAQPIVYNGVMYVTNARATVAIDVATGKQLWRQTLDWPADTPRVVCCGVSNKGAAIYNGKVYRTTLDAYVVAYDAKTGKEIWKSKAAEWKDGFSLTVAPLVANGVLITGISGAEFGVRGFIDGWDPETGKHLWRHYTIPARGEK